MKLLKRIFAVIGTLFLIVLLAIGGWIVYLIRSPMPQVSGTLKAATLSSPVDIYRDQRGIPHIYANNSHDLFLAEGYVHAQERFWQMELTRRLVSGRLSEVFGGDMIEADRYFRTFGWEKVVEAEYQLLDTNTQKALDAYAEGVNVYLSSQQHVNLAVELLGVQGMKYTIEPWTSTDTLRWIKGMAWNMDSNLFSELSRVSLMQKVGPDGVQELRPPYLKDRPIIVPNGPSYNTLNVNKLITNTDILRKLSNRVSYGMGSNSWAISGKLTDTGKPYLADDPHLDIQIPSIWYEIGLHCTKVSADCPYNVVGVSFAGVPGVIIGHNDRISWGFTNLRADVQDLFIERVNPENPTQYEVNGKWVDMQIRKETILLPGEFKPAPEKASLYETSYDSATGFTKVVVSIYTTRHGPILDSTEAQVGSLTGTFGNVQIPEHHAMALRWVGLEANLTIRGVLDMNRAQNFDEFRTALSYFEDPGQSIIYADVDGNIGYQAPGKIPVRAKGDGLLPVPGWTDEYEWTGYIPFEKLPYSYNPPEGYIVTANNAIVGPDFPYLISMEWDPGTRAKRIVNLIEEHKGQPITRDYIEKMQSDTLDLSAQEMVASLKPLHFDDPATQKALDSLLGWDARADRKSGPAALYALFWVELVKAGFSDELAVNQWPNMEVVGLLLKNPDSHWWDDINTKNVTEKRDDILRKAFAAAYGDAVKVMGTNPADWQWEKLHLGTFRETTLGNSGIPPIEAMFNRGPFPFEGSMATINSTHWWINAAPDDPSDTAIYKVLSIPSMRMIVDLGNLKNSLIINSTGQSGHPFNSHYDDMISPWLQNQYHPQLWNRSDVEKSTESHLQLTP